MFKSGATGEEIKFDFKEKGASVENLIGFVRENLDETEWSIILN